MKHLEFGFLVFFTLVFMGSCITMQIPAQKQEPQHPVQQAQQQSTQSDRRSADAMEAKAVADQIDQEKRRLAAEKSEEMKEQGWKIDDPSRTLRYAILEHLKKKEENNKLVEIVGNAGNCKTLNVCQSTARENAQRAYVENISSKIRGASTGHLTSRQTNDTPSDSEQTVNLFQRKFSAEIGRAMMISYGVWRQSFSGGLEYQIVYLIDGGMAEQSARKALQESIEELKLVKEEAEGVKAGLDAIDFGKDGVSASDTSK